MGKVPSISSAAEKVVNSAGSLKESVSEISEGSKRVDETIGNLAATSEAAASFPIRTSGLYSPRGASSRI